MSLRVMHLFGMLDAMLGDPGAAARTMDEVMDCMDDTRTIRPSASPGVVAWLSTMPHSRRFCRRRLCRAEVRT